MPLAPGPFILQPATAVSVAPGTYDFESSVNDWWWDLTQVEAEMDVLWPGLELLETAPSDPVPDIDLDALIAMAASGAGYDLVPEMDDMVQAIADATTQLSTAINDAPSEAFTTPTGAFTPNIQGLVLTAPQIQPGAFQPTTVTPVGVTTPGVGSGGSTSGRGVVLINATQYGASNFTVGDQFKLTATGNAGDHVTVTGTFNGQTFSPVDWGTIDNTGQFVLTGTMGPDSVGVWQENWSVGGQFITTYDFVVTPNSQS